MSQTGKVILVDGEPLGYLPPTDAYNIDYKDNKSVGDGLDKLNADISNLSDTCKMKKIVQTWGSTTIGTTYIVGAVSALLGLTPSSACIGSIAIGGDAAIDTDGTLFINAGIVYYKCGYTQNNTQATFCLIYK